MARDKKYILVLLLILTAMFLALMFVNQWLTKQADKTKSMRHVRADAGKNVTPPRVKAAVPGGVLRKTHLDPGRQYTESILFEGGREIARFKRDLDGKMFDLTGRIPNGKIKFEDRAAHMKGFEHYLNQELHGLRQGFYKDNLLKLEETYRYGILMKSKEFHDNGMVRMEIDYEDARDYLNQKEVGTGKVYFRDGTLKYEWKLTKSDDVGFNKSYNQDGVLRAEVYYDYDENGKIVQRN